MKYTHITDEGTQDLGNLQQLEHLDLTGVPVSDVTVGRLQAGRLQRLYLSGTNISDGALKEIAELEDLKDLQIIDTQVTDAGLQFLNGCQNLGSLQMTAWDLAPESVAVLSGLKGLHAVILFGPKAPEVANQLRSSLPGVQVEAVTPQGP